ncbi:MAG: hypothetical protein ABH914_04660, partial [Candidatus Omnitrophota bacterium]
AADKLYSYGERISSQKIYDIYLEKLIVSLKADKEARLISLATQLAYHDNGMSNPFFAEEIFKKIKGLNPGLALNEQTQYLRAYNLEKIKQYNDAYLQYWILVKSYPLSSHYREAIFKMGVISAYIIGDIPAAQEHFSELIQGAALDSPAFAAFYQLGLISQYRGDIPKAGEYYNTLLQRANDMPLCDDFINRVIMRLKEIEENQPLDFNLRAFMDASCKEAQSGTYSPDIDIKVERFKLTPNQGIKISSSASPAESGCFPVRMEYLWSGDLCQVAPGAEQYNFTAHYVYPGIKLIQLTVITPSGILGRDLVFLEVEESKE